MEHVLAVGRVTPAAKKLIEQAGGRVWHVSDVPSVTLVQLPDPQFCGVEYDRHSLLRVRLHGSSLIWQGDLERQRGPDQCSVDTTLLKVEDGEPDRDLFAEDRENEESELTDEQIAQMRLDDSDRDELRF